MGKDERERVCVEWRVECVCVFGCGGDGWGRGAGGRKAKEEERKECVRGISGWKG